MSNVINRRILFTAIAGSVLLAGGLSSLGAAQAQSRTGGTVNQMTAGMALSRAMTPSPISPTRRP